VSFLTKQQRLIVITALGLLILGAVVKMWFGPETVAIPAEQTEQK
jgi:hypothetical protein